MSRASMSEDGEFLDINWEESDCCTLTVRVNKPSNHEELVITPLPSPPAVRYH